LEGRIISQRESEYPDGLNDEGVKHYLQKWHKARAVELESIFRLNRKIDEKATPDTCWKMGVILLSNGFYEDAKNRFLKALELEPTHFQAAKNYGLALMLLGDLAGAVEALNKAKELSPSFADIYYHLGNTHLFNNDLDQAVQCYIQALQINPRYADARLRLGTACLGYLLQSDNALNDTKTKELAERARKETETAAFLNPKVRNRYFLMGMDYLKSKKYEKAYQSFLDVRPKFLPRTGDEIVFYFNLTLLYGNEGIDMQMTEQYIEKLAGVIEEYPQYADLRHHLAVAYLIECRFAVARSLKEFQKALEINPQYKKAAVHSADVDDLNKRVMTVLRKIIISTVNN
jgi:superkiller protein 3